MASDLTVCSEDALFTHRALSYIGPTEEIVCPGIEIMGLKKMKEMMYTRRPITAEEALQYGLVTRVVARDKLEETVNEMAQVVATLSIDHIMAGKAVIEAMLHMRGVYGGMVVTAMAHNMATWVQWEPDEFNLFKQRRDKGITGAIRAREEMLPPAYRLSRKKEGK